MTEARLRIEMPTADLNELRALFAKDSPAEVRVQPIQDTTAETVRQEPVTIALVCVGTAAGLKALAKVVTTWIEQKEETRRTALEHAESGMQLTLEREGRRTVVTLKDLAEESS